MRIAKILGMVIGGLIALIVVALLAVWLLVNPNDFKPKIAAAVKKATGRELALAGDIKLSVFPWIALELGPASLGNPAGFPEQPFVAFTHASVRVKLLPLLSKRLEIGRVELDGLDLKLLKNAEGQGNWQGFGHSTEPAPAAEPVHAGAPLPEIEGIKVTNARVSYQKISLTNVSLETGSFSGNGVVPVTMHMDADRGVTSEHASLDARFDLKVDPDTERYEIAALNFNALANLAGNDKPVRLSLSAPTLVADLNAQTLSVAAFALNAAGAEVTGSVQGTSIVDAMELKGTIKLAPLIVREFLARVAMALPKTHDPKALSLVSMAGDFAYGKDSARLDQLQVTLDETHLKGKLAVNTTTDAIKFDLAVDSINADRYLPPPEATVAGAASSSKPDQDSKPLNANGTLTVRAVHFSPLDLENVKVTVATDDRVMHIFPLKAQVYGGEYSGNITMDQRAKTPALSLDEHLSGIDMGKLMASASKNLHVTGRGNVNLKATAHGEGADATLKTLNGHFDMNVANGALEGIDLGYALAQAETLIEHQTLSNAPNDKRTKFDAFKMSAQITNGVASTQDLLISSAALKVAGQGSANLVNKTLDFSLLADTLKTVGNAPLQIPVKITGTLADPTVRPDVEALAKSQLKQKLQEKVQGALGDKLKGLFGKP